MSFISLIQCLDPRKACWTVPFERNPRFVGRETQLERLEQTLFAEDQPSRIAITGLGGVGKTQVVLELAYRAREIDPECRVLWFPATNTESLQQAYLEAGRQLCIPGLEEGQADVKELVQRHLSNENAGRWLLIFDNVDDIDIWINQDENKSGLTGLKNYLPRSSQGRTIFTTRSREVAVKLAQSNVLKLSEMDEEMAQSLLRKSLIDPDILQSRQDTLELIQQLTFLPLAIVQATAYINIKGISISDYLSLLKDQEQEVIDLLSEDFEDEGRYQGVKNPIATTWLISFEQIRRRDPLAAEYLSFMCCIDPTHIPQSLLLPAQSRKKETDAIGTLSAYSFVSRRPADYSLDLHRLVHLATRNWLRKEESLAQWTLKAVIRLEEVFPDSDHKNRNLWRMYLPHTRYVLDSLLIKDGVQEKLTLLCKFGMCLYHEGRYDEAEKSFIQVINAWKKVLGEEHPDTLTSIANLASTYRNQGRWKEAEELQLQVLETGIRVLGAEHPDTLSSIHNLALTYYNRGRWKEAEELNMQVIETRKRILGAAHPDTLGSINNLASTYLDQGRWKEAEKLQVQVMETSKMVLGDEHPSKLTSIANLALTYQRQGRWKEAEELNVQVTERSKKLLGAEHPDTLSSINNLASTYLNQGRLKEAEKLQVQLMEISKRVLGTEHPLTLASMVNLVSIHRRQGRLREAEELNIQVIKTFKRALGMEHPSTLSSIANLASTYRKQRRWTEAEELDIYVLETSKRVLGEEHPSTLTSMNNLAFTRKSLGRDAEALQLMEKCVELRNQKLGADHPDTNSSRKVLAKWKIIHHGEKDRCDTSIIGENIKQANLDPEIRRGRAENETPRARLPIGELPFVRDNQ